MVLKCEFILKAYFCQFYFPEIHPGTKKVTTDFSFKEFFLFLPLRYLATP